MKVGARPENLLERLGLALNLAPVPLVDTQIAFNAARAIMSAAKLGIFDAIAERACTAGEVAARCQTHPRATQQLLDCLVGIDYAAWSDGKYTLPRRMRKWLTRSSKHSVVDKLVFQITEWQWMTRLDDFVKTGQPLAFHQHMSSGEWQQYQDGMRDLAATFSVEVAKKLPVPSQATRMLDIGGSHGLYSIELCKKHPSMMSTILELPGAIDRASQIVAQQGLGDRVKHLAGNALTDELGEAQWDVVFISNVVHHFTVDENERLAAKVHRALKPGGIYAVGEFIRSDKPGQGGAIAATSDLYFALTSASGCWSVPEISGWMRKAGLKVDKPIKYLVPGYQTILGKR